MTPGTASASLEIRRYVGKKHASEVFVTGWHHLTADTHLVTARWPRLHPFYVPDLNELHPHLVTETVRQALAVVAHTAFDVPVGYRMGWEQFTCDIAPAELAKASAESGTVELTVTHAPCIRRRLGSMHLNATIRVMRNSSLLGTAHLRYTAFPPALYNRLRGRYADATAAFARAIPVAPPLSPSLVGRRKEADVVLSPTGIPRRWQLRADTSHTTLFDHPHDHVPGMMLLEACSQAALADTAPHNATPVAFETSFFRYVELDQPCWITAHDAPNDQQGCRRVVVTGTQADQAVFSAAVTTRATPPSDAPLSLDPSVERPSTY
ncbi:ScbA/BarX family gamma-butyrolactone biosynthesis protein [Streptomyces sp. NPDC051561]|uniref:ScbA/BarX family gamma-butyrolactone biosynthesis protein n=1 Tax=Streptomyces sp. NPDC051561 TaxID=3365658 RepID=UPI0037930216